MADKNTQVLDEEKFQERLNELLATAKKKKNQARKWCPQL